MWSWWAFCADFPWVPGRLRIYGTDRNFLRRKDNICWPSATIWDQSISWDLYCRYCIGSCCSLMYLVCTAFLCYMAFSFVIACTKIGFRRKQTTLLEETMLRSFWNRPVRLPFLPCPWRMPWMMLLPLPEEASYSWEATWSFSICWTFCQGFYFPTVSGMHRFWRSVGAWSCWETDSLCIRYCFCPLAA